MRHVSYVYEYMSHVSYVCERYDSYSILNTPLQHGSSYLKETVGTNFYSPAFPYTLAAEQLLAGRC